MVHGRRPSGRERKPWANHNRSWIWGRHVVWETLRAGRWPVLELVLGTQLDDGTRQEFQGLARAAGWPVVDADDEELTRRCRAADHQGCAARMAEFPYLTGDELLAALPPRPLIVILDRVQDPFNFGAIVRTLDGLGLDGIVIGSHAQTGVNSQVARSSAGAVNHVPLARVEHLEPFLAELGTRGWDLWGATERGAVAVDQLHFQPPAALVIGNEGHGIAPELVALCAGTVKIPMSGHVSSLNAAVSAGILCYELVRSCRGFSRDS